MNFRHVPLFLILILSVYYFPTFAQTSDKDATYFACDDISKNDFEKADFSNYMYLSGMVNGIIFGAKMAYERNSIDKKLPESPNWPEMIKTSCKAVLDDSTDTRSLDVFRRSVFSLLVEQ